MLQARLRGLHALGRVQLKLWSLKTRVSGPNPIGKPRAERSTQYIRPQSDRLLPTGMLEAMRLAIRHCYAPNTSISIK